jgi:hypothetical protein
LSINNEIIDKIKAKPKGFKFYLAITYLFLMLIILPITLLILHITDKRNEKDMKKIVVENEKVEGLYKNKGKIMSYQEIDYDRVAFSGVIINNSTRPIKSLIFKYDYRYYNSPYKQYSSFSCHTELAFTFKNELKIGGKYKFNKTIIDCEKGNTKLPALTSEIFDRDLISVKWGK